MHSQEHREKYANLFPFIIQNCTKNPENKDKKETISSITGLSIVSVNWTSDLIEKYWKDFGKLKEELWRQYWRLMVSVCSQIFSTDSCRGLFHEEYLDKKDLLFLFSIHDHVFSPAVLNISFEITSSQIFSFIP